MKLSFSLLAIALTFTACSTITVNQRHDETEDFSRLLTYAWMPIAQPSGNLPFDEPVAYRRIKEAVEEKLHYKGYRVASDEEADFLIGFQVALDRQLSAEEVAARYEFSDTETNPALIGPGQPDSSTGTSTYIQTYDQGTLVLNIADAKSRELIWWSSAQAEIHPSDTDATREKRIHKAVDKMLGYFPPK